MSFKLVTYNDRVGLVMKPGRLFKYLSSVLPKHVEDRDKVILKMASCHEGSNLYLPLKNLLTHNLKTLLHPYPSESLLPLENFQHSMTSLDAVPICVGLNMLNSEIGLVFGSVSAYVRVSNDFYDDVAGDDDDDDTFPTLLEPGKCIFVSFSHVLLGRFKMQERVEISSIRFSTALRNNLEDELYRSSDFANKTKTQNWYKTPNDVPRPTIAITTAGVTTVCTDSMTYIEDRRTNTTACDATDHTHSRVYAGDRLIASSSRESTSSNHRFNCQYENISALTSAGAPASESNDHEDSEGILTQPQYIQPEDMSVDPADYLDDHANDHDVGGLSYNEEESNVKMQNSLAFATAICESSFVRGPRAYGTIEGKHSSKGAIKGWDKLRASEGWRKQQGPTGHVYITPNWDNRPLANKVENLEAFKVPGFRIHFEIYYECCFRYRGLHLGDLWDTLEQSHGWLRAKLHGREVWYLNSAVKGIFPSDLAKVKAVVEKLDVGSYLNEPSTCLNKNELIVKRKSVGDASNLVTGVHLFYSEVALLSYMRRFPFLLLPEEKFIEHIRFRGIKFADPALHWSESPTKRSRLLTHEEIRQKCWINPLTLFASERHGISDECLLDAIRVPAAIASLSQEEFFFGSGGNESDFSESCRESFHTANQSLSESSKSMTGAGQSAMVENEFKKVTTLRKRKPGLMPTGVVNPSSNFSGSATRTSSTIVKLSAKATKTTTSLYSGNIFSIFLTPSSSGKSEDVDDIDYEIASLFSYYAENPNRGYIFPNVWNNLKRADWKKMHIVSVEESKDVFVGPWVHEPLSAALDTNKYVKNQDYFLDQDTLMMYIFLNKTCHSRSHSPVVEMKPNLENFSEGFHFGRRRRDKNQSGTEASSTLGPFIKFLNDNFNPSKISPEVAINMPSSYSFKEQTKIRRVKRAEMKEASTPACSSASTKNILSILKYSPDNKVNPIDKDDHEIASLYSHFAENPTRGYLWASVWTVLRRAHWRQLRITGSDCYVFAGPWLSLSAPAFDPQTIHAIKNLDYFDDTDTLMMYLYLNGCHKRGENSVVQMEPTGRGRRKSCSEDTLELSPFLQFLVEKHPPTPSPPTYQFERNSVHENIGQKRGQLITNLIRTHTKPSVNVGESSPLTMSSSANSQTPSSSSQSSSNLDALDDVQFIFAMYTREPGKFYLYSRLWEILENLEWKICYTIIGIARDLKQVWVAPWVDAAPKSKISIDGFLLNVDYFEDKNMFLKYIYLNGATSRVNCPPEAIPNEYKGSFEKELVAIDKQKKLDFDGNTVNCNAFNAPQRAAAKALDALNKGKKPPFTAVDSHTKNSRRGSSSKSLQKQISEFKIISIAPCNSLPGTQNFDYHGSYPQSNPDDSPAGVKHSPTPTITTEDAIEINYQYDVEADAESPKPRIFGAEEYRACDLDLVTALSVTKPNFNTVFQLLKSTKGWTHQNLKGRTKIYPGDTSGYFRPGYSSDSLEITRDEHYFVDPEPLIDFLRRRYNMDLPPLSTAFHSDSASISTRRSINSKRVEPITSNPYSVASAKQSNPARSEKASVTSSAHVATEPSRPVTFSAKTCSASSSSSNANQQVALVKDPDDAKISVAQKTPKRFLDITANLIVKISPNDVYVTKPLTLRESVEKARECLQPSSTPVLAITRELEYREVFNAIHEAIQEVEGTSLYLCGPSGMGKTLVINKVLEAIQERFSEPKSASLTKSQGENLFGTSSNKFNIEQPQIIRMTGPSYPDTNAIYRKLADDLDLIQEGVRQTDIESLVLTRLRPPAQGKRKRYPMVIIVLDEMDRTPKDAVTTLLNIAKPRSYHEEKSKLVVVGIGNEVLFPDTLPLLQAKPTTVSFAPYDTTKLAEIIKSRSYGLFEETAVKFLAMKFARETSGDVRKVTQMMSACISDAVNKLIGTAVLDEETRPIINQGQVGMTCNKYGFGVNDEQKKIQELGLPTRRYLCAMILYDVAVDRPGSIQGMHNAYTSLLEELHLLPKNEHIPTAQTDLYFNELMCSSILVGGPSGYKKSAGLDVHKNEYKLRIALMNVLKAPGLESVITTRLEAHMRQKGLMLGV